MSKSPAVCARPKRRMSSRALKAEYLAWNARQPNPLPICPGCKDPSDMRDSEPLYPHLCSICGTTRLYRTIQAITEAWGPEAARAKLRALARGPMSCK